MNLKQNMQKNTVFILLVTILILGGHIGVARALSYSDVFSYSNTLFSYPSGSLVNDGGTVYLIRGLEKIPFTNWQAFVGLGYNPKNIISGNLSEYSLSTNYKISTANAQHPWYSWLNYNGTIYYSTIDGLVGVPSADVFISNGGQWSEVVLANKYDISILNSNKNLPPLAPADYRVATTPSYQLGSSTAGSFVNTNVSTTPSSVGLATPVIIGVNPTSVAVQQPVSLTGSGFTVNSLNHIIFKLNGATYLMNTLGINSNDGTTLSFIMPANLLQTCPVTNTPVNCNSVNVPTPVGNYQVSVINANGASNSINLDIIQTPSAPTPLTISNLSPTFGPVGTAVTVYSDSSFSAADTLYLNGGQGTSIIPSNSLTASADGKTLTFFIPSTISTYTDCITPTQCAKTNTPVTPGQYNVSVFNGAYSNSLPFTVTAQ